MTTSFINLLLVKVTVLMGLTCLCGVSGMVGLWSLAVIAFERWLVICKPLGNFTFKPEHALACCFVTWVCALAAAAPPLAGWSR